ncbi:segregation/condensation protein A [bacterium]|nr:segregation/condensation protein A [bacterium]
MSTAVVNYNLDLPEIEKNAENEGIGILVSMARAGKIDPWNIDIIDVTDKYLAHCCAMKSDNLRITGRTYLFASVLLNMKSKILDGIDVLQFQDPPEESVEYDEDGFIVEYPEEDFIPEANVQSIEDVLQRRTSVRLNRNRVVTLQDLIRQLKFYEKLDRTQSIKNAHERAKQRVTNYKRFTPDDIINLAHEEYIEECVLRLKDNLQQIFESNDKVELNQLTLLGMDKISAYIALLFLTVDTDYDLYQEKFYSDLYVVKGTGTDGTVEG